MPLPIACGATLLTKIVAISTIPTDEIIQVAYDRTILHPNGVIDEADSNR